MEQHKISCIKLLNDLTVSTFVTRKWIEGNDLSGGQYTLNKNIRFKPPMLRSDLCDYNNAYFVVKGVITVEGTDDANKRNTNLTFKNTVRFRSCLLKNKYKFNDHTEDFNSIISSYNLLEYKDNSL